MASFKKKSLKKHTDENTPYSPSKSVSTVNITMESVGDPDSPLSTNSLIFDGENFVLPLDQDDMNQTNFVLQGHLHHFLQVSTLQLIH